jgi:hypothetical protein
MQFFFLGLVVLFVGCSHPGQGNFPHSLACDPCSERSAPILEVHLFVERLSCDDYRDDDYSQLVIRVPWEDVATGVVEDAAEHSVFLCEQGNCDSATTGWFEFDRVSTPTALVPAGAYELSFPGGEHFGTFFARDCSTDEGCR